MLSKLLSKSLFTIAKKTVTARLPAQRFLAASSSGDIVVPELVDSLEWILSSPPPVHQFDEPPIIVEIEHLENLKPEEIVWKE